MKMKINKFVALLAFIVIALSSKSVYAAETDIDIETQKYMELIQNYTAYPEFFTIDGRIVGELDTSRVYLDDTGVPSYCFSICDITGDGVKELLIGEGAGYYAPFMYLVNVLTYDAVTDTIIDLNGNNIYPIDDTLWITNLGYLNTMTELGCLPMRTYWIVSPADVCWYYEIRSDDNISETFGTDQLIEPDNEGTEVSLIWYSVDTLLPWK